MRETFIFDLDGTLANSNGRDFYNPSHEEIIADLQITPVCKVLRSLSEYYTIVFLSGREAKFYEPTKTWIEEELRIPPPHPQTKKKKKKKKQKKLKLELFNEKIKPNYNVIGIFDDRLQVCRMWYEQGIFCFNVNQGLKEF